MNLRLHAAACIVLTATALVVTSTAASAHDGGKGESFNLTAENPSSGGVPMKPMSNIECTDGFADIFPCDKIDLAAFVPLTDLDSVWANDIWGWTDSATGHEYAVIGLFEGTAFVDVTDPRKPLYLGTLPAADPGADGNTWGGVKVLNDHAYIVGESETHGMQVFDMTRLRGVTKPQEWTVDNHIKGFGQAHNIAVNEDTDRIYVVGAREDVTIPGCEGVAGGPIAFDASNPAEPVLAGCYTADGYSHDIQCVTYHGPDSDYEGREICLASNPQSLRPDDESVGASENTMTILDVTDFDDVEQVARVQYENSAYTHQAWFTEDHTYAMLDDEVDELEGMAPGATTVMWDLHDLDNPETTGTYRHWTTAIDHNIFIKNGLAYHSNYTSGLRITDTSHVDQGQLTERAYFDLYPGNDDAEFNGTWSNYPFFDSGTVVVSSMEEGLFVLQPQVNSSEAAPEVDPEVILRQALNLIFAQLRTFALAPDQEKR